MWRKLWDVFLTLLLIAALGLAAAFTGGPLIGLSEDLQQDDMEKLTGL